MSNLSERRKKKSPEKCSHPFKIQFASFCAHFMADWWSPENIKCHLGNEKYSPSIPPTPPVLCHVLSAMEPEEELEKQEEGGGKKNVCPSLTNLLSCSRNPFAFVISGRERENRG
jgi:hypothetical protein